ncbi:MAG: tetratricopeptide repeat protein [Tepidisphaeraceae bacterium]|jgi:predicted O-linked N-acetylglucosamine transferase (SPINDLY family)
MTLQQQLESGVSHHKAGRLAEAETIYRQILSQNPNHAEALHLLGLIAGQYGNDDQAIDLIGRAIRLKPDFANAHNNLGNSLLRRGRLDEAVSSYKRAIKLKPDFFAAHCNLAAALKNQGQLDESIAASKRAIRLNPSSAEAYNNLGNAQSKKGEFGLAIAAYQRAVQLNPNDGDALCNLGGIMNAMGRVEQAIPLCRRAVQLQPDRAEAHNNLGIALIDNGQFDEADAALQRAIQLKPNYAEALGNLGNVLKEKGQLGQAIAAYRRAIEISPANAVIHSNLVHTVYFHPDYGQAELLRESRGWAARHAHPLQSFIRPHKNTRDPSRRLRIGYVSPDFRSHTQSFFTVPLFAAHDCNQFEVFCYSDVAKPDAITERLRATSSTWRSTVGVPDSKLADIVRCDRIDILVDLTMHMAHNRLLVFARKPAPVQVTWLAYPGTTGLDTIDYRLTDPYLDPPQTGDEFYTEKSIRLPNAFWCYDPMSAQPVGELPAARNGYVTFGSLNNFCKVGDGVLALWSRVLTAVPDSRLILLSPDGIHRQQIIEKLGVQPARVEFVQRMKRDRYLQTHHRFDIVLDTFPSNGHTTSLDALWMGVPVVTLRGQTAVARGGASILSNVGLTEFIAEDPDRYLSIAGGLAGDLSKLAELRSSLRTRIERSPLMNARQFAADIEAAYRQMWRNWVANAE